MDEIYQLIDYLPLDDLEVNNYTEPLFKSAQVTYEKEQYQFSYFAIHLIFMTYIYLTVWKISQFHKEQFEHSQLFARGYNGRSINLLNIESIFEFSNMPEKDIFEFFVLVNVDSSYIGQVKNLINMRNDMAHANGRFQIADEGAYIVAIREILGVCETIQRKMELTIKDWYKNKLINFAKSGTIDNYNLPIDIIDEILVVKLSFSKKDFSACSECGISRFNDRDDYTFEADELQRLKSLHEAIKAKYKEIDEVDSDN